MKIFIIAITFIISIIDFAFSAAPKQNVAAVVVNIQGTLLVKTAGSARFVAARKGQFLYEGDVVKTEKKSLAAITFVSGVQVKINAGTEFTINLKQLGKAEDEMTMNQGQVYSKVLRRGSRFGIRTPVAVASVRGTEFDVQIAPPIKKMVKVKVKKSQLLEKGLEETKKSLKQAYEKEAKEKLAARAAAIKAKLEKKQAEEAAQKAEEAKKEAQEAAKKAEQEKKDAIKKGTIEEVKEAEEAAVKAERAKKAAEEAVRKAVEEKRQQEESETQKKRQEELLKQAELAKEKADAEAKRAEEEVKKAAQKEEEKAVETIVQDQKVSVLEGTVELGNEFGKQSVQAGQYATVATGQAPEPPQPMKTEDKPTWQEQVEVTPKDESEMAQKLQESTTSAVTVPISEPEEKILKMEVETPSGKKILNLKFKKEK